jgi:hypothetical protein
MTILPASPPGRSRQSPNISPQYVLIAVVVVAALVGAYLAFGRGGHPSPASPAMAVGSPVVASTPPAPKITASKLIASAERSLRRAKWGRLTITTTASNGNAETEDIRGGPHSQSEVDTFDGHIAQVVIIRKVAYIDADSVYLQQVVGVPEAEADLASGWLKLLPGDPPYRAVTQNANDSGSKIFPLIKPRVVGVVSRAGVETIEIQGTLGRKRPRQATLYLNDRRPYRPTELDETGVVHGVTINVALHLSDLGQRFRIVEPRRSVSWSQLANETT